jgi:hypothetical protein
MFKAALFYFAALVTQSEVVFAQQPPLSINGDQQVTESQKRKTHLPYVRATTECFTQAVLKQNDIAQKIQMNQIQSAVFSVGAGCSQEVQLMIKKHDEIYGYGTGQSFFTGPYLNDLPRAVLTRIRPVLAQRAVAEAERENNKKSLLSAAEYSRDLVREKMYACTGKQLEILSKSAENAAVLTQAALSLCRDEVNDAISSIAEVFTIKSGNVSTGEFRLSVRDVIQKEVMTQSVLARAALASQSSTPNPLNVQPQLSKPQAPLTLDTVGDCLRKVSTVREGQFVNRDKLIDVMIDLCRPEIEADARSKFLNSKDGNIQDLRRQSADAAHNQAKQIVGIIGSSTQKNN